MKFIVFVPYVRLATVSSINILFTLSTAGDGSSLQTEFRISGRWRMQDPTKHLQAGAKRVMDFFRTRPHNVLAMEDGARKMLLGYWICKWSSEFFFHFLMFSWGSHGNPFFGVARQPSCSKRPCGDVEPFCTSTSCSCSCAAWPSICCGSCPGLGKWGWVFRCEWQPSCHHKAR